MTDRPMASRNADLKVRTISGIAMIVVALVALWLGGLAFSVLILLAALIMATEWVRLTKGFRAAWRFAGLPYIALPILGLLLLRSSPNGFALTLWTLAIVWATDIGAYFAGRAIGGPKLAPAISPAKTWAGLLGGVLLALVVGAALTSRFGLPSACLWLGAPLAILSQIGDLFESWLKRRAGVKDSGNILPGHGGVLDRLDGVVPVASVMGLLLWTGLL